MYSYYFRAQSGKPQGMFTGGMLHDPDPPNLTNPKRVKKLKNFFGEDPPLMRLFLKQLGYEVINRKVLMMNLVLIGFNLCFRNMQICLKLNVWA